MDINKLSNALRRRLAISVYLENKCIDALPTDRDINNINISFWIHKTRRDNKRPVYKLGIHLELLRHHEYFSPANKNTCEKIINILHKKLKQEYKIQLDISNAVILNTSKLFYDKIIYSVYTKSFTYNKIKLKKPKITINNTKQFPLLLKIANYGIKDKNHAIQNLKIFLSS